MNHFHDFSVFVKLQDRILAKSFQDELITRVNLALADAFNRGYEAGKAGVGPLEVQSEWDGRPITELNLSERSEIRKMKQDGRFIDAIKYVRERTNASLYEAKNFVEGVQVSKAKARRKQSPNQTAGWIKVIKSKG